MASHASPEPTTPFPNIIKPGIGVISGLERGRAARCLRSVFRVIAASPRRLHIPPDFCGYGNCILERTERDGNKEAAAAAAPSVVQNDSPWSGISEWGRRLGCVIGSLLFPQPES